MRRIPLRDKTKKVVAYTSVDDEDFRLIPKMRWYRSKERNTFYAKTKYKGKGISLHKLILWCPDGFEIDHLDGNGLNNQRYNLRIVTPQVNRWNQGLNKRNKSGSRGVTWCNQTKSWTVRFYKNYEMFWGGRFKKKKDAIKKADEMKRELYSKEGPVRS